MEDPKNQERNKLRADVIKHILQIRISEELHRRLIRISMAALIVSILAVVVAFWQARHHN